LKTNFNSEIDNEYQDVNENEEIYARSRIYGDFEFDQLKTKKGQKLKFEYNDQGKISNLNEIGEHGITRYKNESKVSNTITLKNSTLLYQSEDNETNIEKDMWVKGVRRAATWIEPSAQKIKERLNDWGFKDSNNLRVLGHSLGSILSSELSHKFGDKLENRASLFIALDPPSENGGYDTTRGGLFNALIGTQIETRTKSDDEINKDYEAKGITPYMVNNERNRTPFLISSRKSRSFYGKFSFAGNRILAAGANESYEIDYGLKNYFKDVGAEHQYVVKTFEKQISQIKLLDTDTNTNRVLNLQNLWQDKTFWEKSMGRKSSDSGELTGIVPDGLNVMNVKLIDKDRGITRDQKFQAK
jgi:hypothetical protein